MTVTSSELFYVIAFGSVKIVHRFSILFNLKYFLKELQGATGFYKGLLSHQITTRYSSAPIFIRIQINNPETRSNTLTKKKKRRKIHQHKKT